MMEISTNSPSRKTFTLGPASTSKTFSKGTGATQKALPRGESQITGDNITAKAAGDTDDFFFNQEFGGIEHFRNRTLPSVDHSA